MEKQNDNNNRDIVEDKRSIYSRSKTSNENYRSNQRQGFETFEVYFRDKTRLQLIITREDIQKKLRTYV